MCVQSSCPILQGAASSLGGQRQDHTTQICQGRPERQKVCYQSLVRWSGGADESSGPFDKDAVGASPMIQRRNPLDSARRRTASYWNGRSGRTSASLRMRSCARSRRRLRAHLRPMGQITSQSFSASVLHCTPTQRFVRRIRR
jgi:hypothetical protein